jgi:hypothetical protein
VYRQENERKLIKKVNCIQICDILEKCAGFD